MLSNLKQVLSEKFISREQREPEYNTALVHTGVLAQPHNNYSCAGAECQYGDNCGTCSERTWCHNWFTYKVISGKIYAKRLKPVMVKSSLSRISSMSAMQEGKLETYVLYPKTETAVVEIRHGTNSPYTDTITLRKFKGRGDGVMYRKEP